MKVIKRDGTQAELDVNKLNKAAEWACEGLEGVSMSDLVTAAHIQLSDGISTQDIQTTLVKTANDKISMASPNYTYVAARLLLQQIRKTAHDGRIDYPSLKAYLPELVEVGRIDPRLLDYNLEALDKVIVADRDLQFAYLGLQTLADRYFLRHPKTKALRELPQHFFMRVAMGVALAEKSPELRHEKAVEFYETLSTFAAMSSSPTLFNSGTTRPQLSSCFVMSMGDDIDQIMGTLTEAAQYSKYSGGCGLDQSQLRSESSPIKSTNGEAAGLVPYAKIYNDVLLGFDQGGKRLGAGSLYLEPWHADVLDFMEIKNPAGDDRRRARDIFPAMWLNDLFLERVVARAEWSLFSPSDVPELPNSFGEEFKKHYLRAEKAGLARKVIPAVELWHTILRKAFELGVFWPCFKDEANRRYPQKQDGIVRSSNLCTEILLRTSTDISAVCNLGSINVAKFDPSLPDAQISQIVKRMVRFLDNVIEVGFIPHERGRKFNKEDRAIGLGIMGYAELLVKAGIDYESPKHVNFASRLMEKISYYAIEASHELALEKGSYPKFASSEWAKGVVPIDTARPEVIQRLQKLGLGEKVETMDWKALRAKVKLGMRNSCLLAIAPTATISNITGTTPCTELPYQLEYAKGNLSGSFRQVACTLSHGNRDLCKSAYQVNQKATVHATAARQLWIDQGQSTNFFVYEDVPGKVLNELYLLAWELGLKTTYYLRSKSPQFRAEREDEEVRLKEISERQLAEKAAELEIVPHIPVPVEDEFSLEGVKACLIDNPDCESCQ